MTAQLAIIIPTYNEIENIDFCIAAITGLPGSQDWELIFVDDDSGDGTSAYVREVANRNGQVRCLQRLGRRGLSSACIEGILATSAPYICVMDVDMQHDENIIPEMLGLLRGGGLDIVIGSRKVDDGSMGGLPPHRVFVSNVATAISNLVLGSQLRDPMSGFFMLTREFFERTMYDLSGKGFKILLDIMVTARTPVRYREIPYVMRERQHGQSKLDATVVMDFFALLVDKLIGRLLPARFVLFVLVGLSGVLVHLLSLGVLHKVFEAGFIHAQLVSTYLAMTSNFILNNLVTYREMRLRGWQFIRGLLSFYLACSFGAIINIALADFMYNLDVRWWLAGITGATAGAIWNYFITAIFTWRVYTHGPEPD